MTQLGDIEIENQVPTSKLVVPKGWALQFFIVSDINTHIREHGEQAVSTIEPNIDVL